MGCHTWFHEKVKNPPSYEEVRDELLKLWKVERCYYERHLAGTLEKDEESFFDGATRESSEHALRVLDRLSSRLEKRLCRVATMRRVGEVFNGLTYCERNGHLYRDVENYHDVFRIGKYPLDELLSLEETLQFLEKNSEKIFFGPSPVQHGREEVEKKLREFWKKHPEGMITFG